MLPCVRRDKVPGLAAASAAGRVIRVAEEGVFGGACEQRPLDVHDAAAQESGGAVSQTCSTI